MTDIEKQIWVQVYSWHMASFQKRNDFDGLTVSGLQARSIDAIEQATDAVRAFRATQNNWITTETNYMLKELLDESNTTKYSIAQNQHTLNIPPIDFSPRWEK
jgi:Ser-tRNA(Ala) deacylase AlaX